MTANKNRILIAEDDELLRPALLGFFESLGYEVVSVSDGQKALDLIRETQFDVVITDIRMPTKTGIDLLERVEGKRKKGLPMPRVIIMTGLLDEGEAYLKALGAFAVLEKPMDMKVLVRLVNAAIAEGTAKGTE